MSHSRSLFVRIMNYCWFWDLERSFPGYPQFDVAENILHTVNNQGLKHALKNIKFTLFKE